jgi:hypothetical protein
MYLEVKRSSSHGSSSSLLLPSGYDVLGSSSYSKTNVMYSRNRKANIALVVSILTLCTVCLVHAFFVLKGLITRVSQDEHVSHVVSDHGPHSRITPVKLESESSFRSTIRLCLPNLSKKCQTYIPEDRQRVAILAPKGEFGNWIFKWASKVVDTKLASTAKMDLQLVSNVPPYGYGKTHGWTKLIRILPRSLMLGAADALRGSLLLGQAQDSLTLRDLKATLRQLLRYHCRISHLAAHTAVLTFDMDLMSRAPYTASESILSFLNITAIDHGEVEDADMEQKESSDDRGRYFMREQDIMAKSNNVEAYAASLLTWIEQHEQVDIQKELNAVLQEELEISKNFTKWPCESFWTTGDGPNHIDMSAFSERVAHSLAPNCKAPFTSCGVKKDQCEQDGDPFCKTKP